jgi:hypothetical protein
MRKRQFSPTPTGNQPTQVGFVQVAATSVAGQEIRIARDNRDPRSY